jgi:hypothetical protein
MCEFRVSGWLVHIAVLLDGCFVRGMGVNVGAAIFISQAVKKDLDYLSLEDEGNMILQNCMKHSPDSTSCAPKSHITDLVLQLYLWGCTNFEIPYPVRCNELTVFQYTS